MSTRGSAVRSRAANGVSGMWARNGARIEMHAVAVDMAERAEIGRAEGLQPVGRGLDDVARGVDLVVQHDQNTLAARLGRAGDAQGVDEVHAGIGAERAGRALRSDQHDGLLDREGQVEEKRGLLEGRGAVRDDKAGDSRLVARDAVDQRPDLEPILGADIGAADLAERDRHRVGDEPGLRKTGRASASQVSFWPKSG